MKIAFDNVNFSSSSGPNSFATKLATVLKRNDLLCLQGEIPTAQLSFIQSSRKVAPIFQRLDGIYFNTSQDWELLNRPIKNTFDTSLGVIYQSEFNKKLTDKYFGEKENYAIIHNGSDLDMIANIPAMKNKDVDSFSEVYCCASSWRPHKRLSANIEYFLKCASEDACLVVAGPGALENGLIGHPRILYAGELDYAQLVSLYKRSEFFIHLAYLDHCPNVVVDARAAGCKIICTDSGGTREIAGLDAIVVKDREWDFSPHELYQPPVLNFENLTQGVQAPSNDISDVANLYVDFMKSSLDELS